MRITDVYAYFKGNKEDVDKFLKGINGEIERRIKKQTLKQHVKESIKTLENIMNTKIWNYYVNISEYDEKTVEKWMKFAIAFHDIGKIFYQRNFKPYKDEKYLNFTGHEFISTFLADRFLSLWLEKDIKSRIDEYRNFRWVICASILYHHHAMGLKGRERLDEIRVCERRDEFKEIVKNVYGILQNYLEGFEDSVILSFVNELKKFKLINSNYVILNQTVISDIFRYVDELNLKIWENFVKDNRFRKLMLLATDILILADYKGSENRGERPTKFGEIVNEFINCNYIRLDI